MLKSKQGIQSNAFHGVRFVLFGFDVAKQDEVKLKLISGGGVDVGQYGPDCTHVIVSNLVYDDPVCVTARGDGKIIVTSLWVDHSLDVGMPVDASPVMYQPPKDLNGIPGAKDLVMCLTGYQRQDRDDIMIMVGLMGAEFSKPLVANRVTHLICYKFEGEKYELAKRIKKIKLVNHRWLEDCLKAWKILPEEHYNKSGYELEKMEAEVKDSEEETEDPDRTLTRGETVNASPHNFPNRTIENHDPPAIGSTVSGMAVTHGLSVNTKDTDLTAKEGMRSDQATKYENFNNKDPLSNKDANSPTVIFSNAKMPGSSDSEKFGALSYSGKTPGRASLPLQSAEELVNISRVATSAGLKRLADSDADKLSSFSYSRKTPRKSDLSLYASETLEKSNEMTKEYRVESKPNVDSCVSPSKAEPGMGNSAVIPIETSQKGADFIDEGLNVLPQKRNIEGLSDVSPASSKQKKLSTSTDHVVSHLRDETVALSSAQKLPSNLSPTNLKFGELTSKSDLSLSKSSNPETLQGSSSKNVAALNSSKAAFTEVREAQNEKEESFTPETLQGSSSKNLAARNGSKGAFSEVREAQDEREDVGINSSYKKDLEILNSDNSKLKSAGGTDESLSNPMKKKTVAKKMLGSRPKLNRKSATNNNTNNKGSIYLSGTSPQDDASKRENHEKSSDKDKITSPATEAAAGSEMQDLPDSGFVVNNDAERVDHDTVAPPENRKMENEKAATKAELNTSVLIDKASGAKAGSKKQKSAKKTEDSKNRRKKVTGKEDRVVRATSINKSTLMNEDENEDGKKVTGKKNGVLGASSNEKDESISVRKSDRPSKAEKENEPVTDNDHCKTKSENLSSKSKSAAKNSSRKGVSTSSSSSLKNAVVSNVSKNEPAWFIVSGHRLQRKEFQQVIKKLKGKLCRDSHQWSYQATHFVVPDPIRRTEKFFAAAASGRWILKTDYLRASSEAGRLLPEEPYEWFKNGLSEDGAINLEAPRKWRLLREKTGHGAFYGMCIVVYGECIAPPLDTIKRAVKAGDGTILATSPPYTRFLKPGLVDFAIVSPGMPSVDVWVQEFLRHEIPCVSADYLVEYICKPGYSPERHVQYNTHKWATKSFANLSSRLEEIAEEASDAQDNQVSDDLSCSVCGRSDRGEVMLICGDESGSSGCGIGTHIDCCDPPLKQVPNEDWFCPDCASTRTNPPKTAKKRAFASKKP